MPFNSPIDPNNLIIIPATMAGSLRHGDWKGAMQRGGVIGFATEAAHSVIGTNTEPFFIPEDSDWKLQDIQALLSRYGIKLWGVAYWNKELYFRVKKRQAHWAQYVMLRAGVPLLHGLLEGSRAIPGAGRAAPDAAGGGQGPMGAFLDWLGRQLG